MKYIYNDGGRKAEGFTGTAGDCVTRSISIAASLPYHEVYDALAAGNAGERKTKRGGRSSGTRSAANGIHTKRQWFKDYMRSLGFSWVSCMGIGTGCKVHLHGNELPVGSLVVAVSKHYTAVIDGVINDTFDPRREAHLVESDNGQPLKPGQWRNSNGICSIQRRCVYGYWIKG